MTTAIILINVERSKLKKTAEQIKGIEGVAEVYTVAGEYDLVAMLKLKDISKLSKILTEKMSAIDGIIHTKTLLSLDVLTD
jgi:DNA-binding Lrp family transcriptional regulator